MQPGATEPPKHRLTDRLLHLARMNCEGSVSDNNAWPPSLVRYVAGRHARRNVKYVCKAVHDARRGAYVPGIENGANEQRDRQNSLQACTLAHACACAINACVHKVGRLFHRLARWHLLKISVLIMLHAAGHHVPRVYACHILESSYLFCCDLTSSQRCRLDVKRFWLADA